MKKITTILLALLVISIVSASIAFAYGEKFGANTGEIQTHYQDMQEIMGSGTYGDLVEYKQTSGFNIMPWVQDEEDFTLAKERHAEMIQWRGENNIQSGQGYGRNGGCPMMNNRAWQ